MVYHRVMRPNDAGLMVNSRDPDPGLHYLPRPVCPKTYNHYGSSFLLSITFQFVAVRLVTKLNNLSLTLKDDKKK